MEFAPWPLSGSRCFLCRFRQRALTSVAAGCEPFSTFPLLPGLSTCPAWLSAASVAARCEPFSAFPLTPDLSTCLARPSAASVAARCEPVPAFPLLPDLSTCPAWPSVVSVAARCEPFSAFPLLPGPSTHPAWLSPASASARCEPFSAFPLLPGPPTCLARLSAASVAARCEPFSENRLTPASRDLGSWSGTMAAGAREQAASCDAFVLSRRPPAPDAPLKRGISFAKIRGFKVADYNPRLAPRPWNLRRRVEHRRAHQGRFHSPR